MARVGGAEHGDALIDRRRCRPGAWSADASLSVVTDARAIIDSDLQSLLADYEWPSPAYLVGAVIFGLIGFAAFRYGRKNDRLRTTWIGVTLMLYPYVVSVTWLLYVVGIALCVGLWLDRA